MATQSTNIVATIVDGPSEDFLQCFAVGRNWTVEERVRRFEVKIGDATTVYRVTLSTAAKATDAELPWLITGSLLLVAGVPAIEHSMRVFLSYDAHKRSGTFVFQDLAWRRVAGSPRGSTVSNAL